MAMRYEAARCSTNTKCDKNSVPTQGHSGPFKHARAPLSSLSRNELSAAAHAAAARERAADAGVAGLAWRKVHGKYEFHGLAPPSTLSALFPLQLTVTPQHLPQARDRGSKKAHDW